MKINIKSKGYINDLETIIKFGFKPVNLNTEDVSNLIINYYKKLYNKILIGKNISYIKKNYIYYSFKNVIPDEISFKLDNCDYSLVFILSKGKYNINIIGGSSFSFLKPFKKVLITLDCKKSKLSISNSKNTYYLDIRDTPNIVFDTHEFWDKFDDRNNLYFSFKELLENYYVNPYISIIKRRG